MRLFRLHISDAEVHSDTEMHSLVPSGPVTQTWVCVCVCVGGHTVCRRQRGEGGKKGAADFLTAPGRRR